MIQPKLAKQLEGLPNQPGVYRYFSADNTLLYIGKATSLSRRVHSYFQKVHDAKTEELVRRIDHLSYTVTDSVIEALIQEANEINLRQPPFNIRQKDDKTFVVIGITNEDFPRILITRPTTPLKIPLAYQFGPYPSTASARIALGIIRKIFPYRSNCTVNPNKARGCLDFQIGLCPGPCAHAISRRAYHKTIRHIVTFLEGKKRLLLKRLTREMEKAAKAHRYEDAAALRNQVFALRHIRDVALIRREDHEDLKVNKPAGMRIEAYDISNIGSEYAVGSLVVVQDGKPDKQWYRKFRIKTIVGQNDVRMMEEVLTRRLRHIEWPLPNLFVIDGGLGHVRAIARIFRKFRIDVPLIGVAKGPERKKLDIHTPGKQKFTVTSELLQAIRLARDEAHRFAITYHRSRRDEQFLVE